MKNTIRTMFTLVALVATSVFANAIDKKNIVGGVVKRFPTTPTKVDVPSAKKRVDLVSRYRGSKHERALDAQIRNYRASARANERVFGAPYRKSTASRKLDTNAIFKIIIDASTGKKYYIAVK